MKRRVAIVSSCAPPLPGQPVTGGGLRTAQLVETVRRAGHSPRLLVDAAALPEPSRGGAALPNGVHGSFDDDESLAAALAQARCSVVICEQWALAARLAEAGLDKPLVIDLHGSLLLENVYRRGELDVVLDAGTKLDALRAADLLLCPSEAQMRWFGSWATLAGFDPRELPLQLLPLALPGEPSPPRTEAEPTLQLVYGGARWPWIDSLSALRAAADAIADTWHATLDVFAYEPPRHGLPLQEDLGTWPEVDAALTGRAKSGVRLHDGCAHGKFRRFLEGTATVALDCWRPNPERMLAATTRSVEYLWSGLPVITVEGASWASALLQTGAGWVVPADDEGALGKLLTELAADPARIAAASAAATALARSRHTVEAAGGALVDFLARPHRPPRAEASLVTAMVAVRRSEVDAEADELRATYAAAHDRIVELHRAEVEGLRAGHQAAVEQLSSRHQAEVGELTGAHRELVSSLREDFQSELAKATERQAEQADKLRTGFEAELTSMRQRDDAERARLLDEHGRQVEGLAEGHRKQMLEAKADRDVEVQQLVSQSQTELAEADRRHRAETERTVAEWTDRVAQWTARVAEQGERVAELEERLTRENNDASDRHRAEMEATVSEWTGRVEAMQEGLRRARDKAKEERSRLEVELRGEIGRLESELVEARRLAVPGVDAVKAGLSGVRGALPGRTGPALRLAKLWVEHALDRDS